MTTETTGKVLILISEETDSCYWPLSNQTETAEQAMTGVIIFFSLDFSFCHLTAHCFHSVLKGQIHFLRLLTEGSNIHSGTVSFSFLAHVQVLPFH